MDAGPREYLSDFLLGTRLNDTFTFEQFQAFFHSKYRCCLHFNVISLNQRSSRHKNTVPQFPEAEGGTARKRARSCFRSLPCNWGGTEIPCLLLKIQATSAVYEVQVGKLEQELALLKEEESRINANIDARLKELSKCCCEHVSPADIKQIWTRCRYTAIERRCWCRFIKIARSKRMQLWIDCMSHAQSLIKILQQQEWMYEWMNECTLVKKSFQQYISECILHITSVLEYTVSKQMHEHLPEASRCQDRPYVTQQQSPSTVGLPIWETITNEFYTLRSFHDVNSDFNTTNDKFHDLHEVFFLATTSGHSRCAKTNSTGNKRLSITRYCVLVHSNMSSIKDLFNTCTVCLLFSH